MSDFKIYELFKIGDFKEYPLLSQVNELEGVSFEAVFNTVGGVMFRVFDDELENQNFLLGLRKDDVILRGRYLFMVDDDDTILFGIKQD
jgi:hypothetical protein